ncbi:MAG: phage major capsid protein [Selenomonadaceae bacterium]|nr:phage major capsid protein [Selenomonadaceae bacterium]
MTIQELYDKRVNLVENARKFLEEHTDADGKISAEDEASYDKMESDIAALDKQIERFENQEKREAQLSALQPLPAGVLSSPNAGGGKTGRASDEYRKAAIQAIRSKFGKVSNALQTNPDLSGGYLIPAEWDNRLIQTLEEENVMRKLGTSFPTSGEHKINIAATKPAALWVAEGGAMTFGNGTFAQISLDAHKVHVGILVTEELLNDNAFGLENYILDQFGKAIANAEEDAFINGDGNGKPTGFLTTLAADATTYITTSGASMSADDVINLEYSLKRPYRRNAAWLINDATLAQIRKFKDSTSNYIWQPSYVAGEPDRLLGYPLYSTPYMPTPQSGNFALAFGDFSYYNIADRGSRVFQRLEELFAGNGMTGFLLKERVDGMLIDNSAVRGLKIK